MGGAAARIGWRRICAAILLASSAGFLGWRGLSFHRLIADIAALNGGDSGFIQFPLVWFIVSCALLGAGAVALRWAPIVTAVIAVGVALCAQLLWLAVLF